MVGVYLAPYAVDLMERYSDGSDEHKRALVIAKLLTEFYDLLNNEGEFLSPEAERRMKVLGNNLVILYMTNSQSCLESNPVQLRWKWRHV